MKYPLSCLVSVALVGGSLFAGSVLAGDPLPTAPTVLKKDVIQKKFAVTLECKNPGSSQQIAMTPWVKNTTHKTIPKGHKIYWAASNGEKDVITLEKNLPAGQKVMGLLPGNKGNNYTCTASTSPF